MDSAATAATAANAAAKSKPSGAAAARARWDTLRGAVSQSIKDGTYKEQLKTFTSNTTKRAQEGAAALKTAMPGKMSAQVRSSLHELGRAPRPHP